MSRVLVATMMLTLVSSVTEARVARLRIERREVVLNGRAFGAAGPYEKIVGKVDFGVDPNLPRNGAIVDLPLGPRNARGEVEATADFYLLKPVDPRRGNGRLFYEVGNRGGKSLLQTFQKAAGSPDPVPASPAIRSPVRVGSPASSAVRVSSSVTRAVASSALACSRSAQRSSALAAVMRVASSEVEQAGRSGLPARS